MILCPPDPKAGDRVSLAGQFRQYRVITRAGDWVKIQKWDDPHATPLIRVHVNTLEYH